MSDLQQSKSVASTAGRDVPRSSRTQGGSFLSTDEVNLPKWLGPSSGLMGQQLPIKVCWYRWTHG